MYKIIKREVFKNGELTETVYEVGRDGYCETVIEIKDWEQFKKAVAEAK